MGIKNFIVAAVICSLISVSSSLYYGIACYTINFPGKYIMYKSAITYRRVFIDPVYKYK